MHIAYSLVVGNKRSGRADVFAVEIKKENVIIYVDTRIFFDAVVKGAFVRIVSDKSVFTAFTPCKLVAVGFEA